MEEYKYKVVSGGGGSYVVERSSKFYLKYKKGKYVRAPKGSLGIMLFESKKLAESFMFSLLLGRPFIKRVIPIGKATFPDRVAGTVDSRSIERFNCFKQPFNCCVPPEGTVCYPEVFVVD